MQKLQKIRQLLLISPLYDLKAWLYFWKSLLFGTTPTPVSIFTDDEVLKYIIEGKSVIRLGDGEMMILTGRDIYFQPTSKKLAEMLTEMISNYSEKAPYLLGIPHEKISALFLDKKQHRLWRWYRIYFPLRFKTNETYTSPILFYHLHYFKEKVAPLFKDFHIVWVANETAIAGVKNYARTVGRKSSFVQIPKTNSFREYERIKQATLDYVRSTTLPTIVLCSGGPATKVLLYELSHVGIQGLDIGHGMNVIIEDTDRAWTY